MINAHDNFINDTAGSIAPGWVNGTGASFVVQASTPSAGYSSLCELTYTNGHTAIYTATAAAADSCAQISQVAQIASGTGYGANVGLSLRTDAAATTTGYYFLPDFYGGTVAIYKRVGGTYSNVNVTSMGLSWTNGQKAWLKVQVAGTTLSWKVWAVGNAEPASWTLSIADSSISAAGYTGLYCGANNGQRGTTTYCQFSDFFQGTSTTNFPVQLVTTLGGVLYTSPFNWNVNLNGTGALATVNPGAELDLVTSASTPFYLHVALANLVGAGFPAGSYPKIKYSTGGAYTTYQLLSTDVVVYLGTGTTLQLFLEGLDNYDGNPSGPGPLNSSVTKWSGYNSLVIFSVLINFGITPVAYTPPAKTWLWYGDSITEGEWQLGDSSGNLANAVAWAQGSTSHAALVSQAFGAQCCNCAFGGTDWLNTFYSDVPPLPTTYNKIYNGVARSFTTPPTYWSVNLGANAQLGTLSGSAAVSLVVSTLTSIRGAVGSASQGVLWIPVGGQQRTNLTNAYAAYMAANPTDNLVLIDINSVLFYGTYGTSLPYTFDGLHPNQLGHALIGATGTLALAKKLTAPSGGNINNGSGVFSNGSSSNNASGAFSS